MNDQVDILLVEDPPADLRLTREALATGKMMNKPCVVGNGTEAMRFLHREGAYLESPRPDLNLFDLNFHGKDGQEVLMEVKSDPDLTRTPVIILTTTQSEDDILRTYNQYANKSIIKPMNPEQFFDVIKHLKEFWLDVAALPSHGKRYDLCLSSI